MKAIVTGVNGTVAPILAKTLVEAGHTVVAWDRSSVPTDDLTAIRQFIEVEEPQWFFHLATGSPDWAEAVARTCAQFGVSFLFTSSVSVYSSLQHGPFTVEHHPQPDDDYGRYKLHCEERIRAVNTEARVARIGWQIGSVPEGNHMLNYLIHTIQTERQVTASINWYQACSFLEDTADSLVNIMKALPAGTYHVDGNPGLNFHEIVTGLNRLHGGHWEITPSQEPKLNNRLLEERLQTNLITNHFNV